MPFAHHPSLRPSKPLGRKAEYHEQESVTPQRLLVFLLPRLRCRLLLGARVKVRDSRLKRIDGHSTRIRFASVDVDRHPSSRGADTQRRRESNLSVPASSPTTYSPRAVLR